MYGFIFMLFAKSAKLMKVLKGLKFAKFFITFATMSLSAFAYAFAYGSWYFGLGLVAMLLIHEMGHVVALKKIGIPASAPVFIPFFGAAIFAKMPERRDQEAFVGYGGPLLGSIGAFALFGVYLLMQPGTMADVVLITSFVGVYINLFNMIPISPFDGGRITQAVGPWMKYIGVAMLVVFSALLKSPVVLLIWLLVLPDLSFVSKRVRGVLAILLYITMGALFLLGYGKQPVWVNWLDMILGMVFTFGMVFIAFFDDEGQAVTSERPTLPFGERMTWLAYYFGLGAVLVYVLIVQASYMPKQILGG